MPVVSWDHFRSRPFKLWRYRELIPVPHDADVISLSEGGTPLIRVRNIGDELDVDEAFIKFEGANPTGSFKDRGMTVGITMAKYLGATSE
jgi:threonine synthase